MNNSQSHGCPVHTMGANPSFSHCTCATLKSDILSLADYLCCNGEELYNELKPIVKNIKQDTLNKVKEVLKKEGYILTDKIEEPIKMAHGECCCCRDCGRYHDECVCESNNLLKLLENI